MTPFPAPGIVPGNHPQSTLSCAPDGAPLTTSLPSLDAHLVQFLQPGRLVVVCDAEYTPESPFQRQLTEAFVTQASVPDLPLHELPPMSLLDVLEFIRVTKLNYQLKSAIVSISSFELLTVPSDETFDEFIEDARLAGMTDTCPIPPPPTDGDYFGAWRAQVLQRIALAMNVLIVVGLDRTDLSSTQPGLVTPRPWLASLPRPQGRFGNQLAQYADLVLMPWHHGADAAVICPKNRHGEQFEVELAHDGTRYTER